MYMHFILQYTTFAFAQSYRISCEIALYYKVDVYVHICNYITML